MATKKKSETTGDKVTTASVLAFERKLDPSDAIMSAGLWTERSPTRRWPPIVIVEKSVRGTISNRVGTLDPAKLDAKIQSPNLQRVDCASLPHTSDTLSVAFTLRVISGVGTPSACNNAAYQDKLRQTVDEYKKGIGFEELSLRYSTTLAMGSFLWRNRMGAEMCEVHVQLMVDGIAQKSWKFDAFEIGKGEFPSREKNVQELALAIREGLEGTRPTLLAITAYVRLGAGQEVYPSQELILDRSKGSKSKTLYQVGGAAAIHSQKVGNAIRTIDTWYGEGDTRAIAVEPYGSVTNEGRAYRQPKDKRDFYSLFDSWIVSDVVPEPAQQHYVIATLLRGGVFGEAEKAKE